MLRIKTIIFMFVLGAAFLQAEPTAKKTAGASVLYKIIDLGECGLPVEQLLVHGAAPSIAPRLNHSGQVICNRKAGGFIWRHKEEQFIPYMTNQAVQFHALNGNGDVLVSLKGTDDSVNWEIWSTGAGAGEKREPIPKLGLGCEKIYFCDIDNHKMVSGYYFNADEQKQIVMSTGDKGSFFPLESNLKCLLGDYQGMNQTGLAYGFMLDNGVEKPTVWSSEGAVFRVKNYRSKIVPEGDIILESLTMTDDGIAYGSYWVKYPKIDPIVSDTPKNYYNFAWQPTTDSFKLIDIDGMQIHKVNNIHTLVGAMNGKPAICESAKKPVEFSRLIHPDQLKEWEIIQISDINDDNHLVGIGKYRGDTHIFFAERMK